MYPTIFKKTKLGEEADDKDNASPPTAHILTFKKLRQTSDRLNDKHKKHQLSNTGETIILFT